jgi:hypothetical protein
MAGVSAYAEKAMLDWVLGGATPTRPDSILHSIGLSLGVPTSVSASELATGSGANRQPSNFGAAASPAGSASNATAMTFGPFSAGATVSGLQVWDTNSPTGGNMLWYGTLATARTLGAGDSLVFAVGALVITLA